MSKRAEAAATIVEHADQYKVCDQCESILRKTAASCSICHAYRWREETGEVARIALILGSHEGLLAPVLPR